MAILTEKEREALLILVKDFNSYYNANSLSKKVGISHVGAQKILKRFKEEGLTATKTIGKSRIHKPRIDDEYKQKLLSFLLADEANNFKRWKDEFKELFKKGRIVMIYGSAIKNYKAASDIDIMVVIKKGEVDEVNKIINKINMILPKEVHCIKLTEKDLLENIKEKNEAISDIIKNAIVLHGYDRYVEVIKNVASF
jgi:predicted nucleotidyltransferase